MTFYGRCSYVAAAVVVVDRLHVGLATAEKEGEDKIEVEESQESQALVAAETLALIVISIAKHGHTRLRTGWRVFAAL